MSREKHASPGSRRKTINWGHICPFVLHPAGGLTFGPVLSLLCCTALQNRLPLPSPWSTSGLHPVVPPGTSFVLICVARACVWFPRQPTNPLVTGPGCSPDMSMCFSAWSAHSMCPHEGERTRRRTGRGPSSRRSGAVPTSVRPPSHSPGLSAAFPTWRRRAH